MAQLAGAFYARPTSSFGYWRGGGSEIPLTQNQGSGYGQDNQGAGILPPGSGGNPGPGAWTPTLTYLFVFVAAEMILFGVLARVLG